MIIFSVSAINVLVNVFVIVVVLLGSELGQYAIFRETQLMLHRHGRAPVLTEADNIFKRLQNRFFGARRSKGFVALVIFAITSCLIFAELAAEFGVQTSNRCAPQRIETDGLCAQRSYAVSSESRKIATAFFARIAQWNDDELEQNPIYEGLRKNYNGRECFTRNSLNHSHAIIIANCSISPMKVIAPYSGYITLGYVASVWKTIVSEVAISNTSKPLFGRGDVTHNGKQFSAFHISVAETKSPAVMATVVESHDSKLLQDAVSLYFTLGNFSSIMLLRSSLPMFTYNVTCGHFSQVASTFVEALQIYRSVQLEDIFFSMKNITVGGKTYETIPPLSAADAVRAAIAQSSLNPAFCKGETYVYSECGVYEWKYMAPLLILLFGIGTFAVIKTIMVVREDADIQLPHTSSAWSAMVLREEAEKQTTRASRASQMLGEGTETDTVSTSEASRSKEIAYRSWRNPSTAYYELDRRENEEDSIRFTFDRSHP